MAILWSDAAWCCLKMHPDLPWFAILGDTQPQWNKSLRRTKIALFQQREKARIVKVHFEMSKGSFQLSTASNSLQKHGNPSLHLSSLGTVPCIPVMAQIFTQAIHIREYQEVFHHKLCWPNWSTTTISEKNANSEKNHHPDFTHKASWLLQQQLFDDFPRSHPRPKRTAEQELYHVSPSWVL